MKNHQFIHISTVKPPPMDNQEYGWIYITDNPLGSLEFMQSLPHHQKLPAVLCPFDIHIEVV